MESLVLAVAAMVLPALASTSTGPDAEGRIESDEGKVEVLGRPLRAGDRVDLPEGFLRVEEDGNESGEIGSFSVVSAERIAPVPPERPDEASAGDPAGAGTRTAIPSLPVATATSPVACRTERSAYLAELMKESGIEISDPSALLEGLQGGSSGPASGFYWFALATDAFRPLAWSTELRYRADALMRCIRAR